MDLFTIFFGFFVFLLVVLVRHLRKNRGCLEGLGIPIMKHSFLLGSYDFDIHNKNYHTEQVEWVKKYGMTFGIYEGIQPVIATIDPDIIKTVTVKEFESFTDIIDLPLEDRHNTLDVSKGDTWRVLRKQMSPTFSSGKLKAMMAPMEIVADQMKTYLDEQVTNGNGRDMNIKKVFISLSLETISQCAFGIENNSFKNQNSELAKQAEALFAGFRSENYASDLLFTVFNYFPAIMHMIPLFPAACDRLGEISKGIMASRRKNGVVKSDFLQKMQDLIDEIESQKSSDPEVLRLLNEDILLAQCAIFFAAGHETTANALTSFCYNMALHEDIQESIADEIREAKENNGNKITYGSLEEMKYLEAAINENLRLNGPVTMHIRTCTKDCEIKPGLLVKKGMRIDMPIYAGHHYPEFFPQPDQFRPERFLKENEQDIKPYTFRAFGGGNRFCIGQRFAMVEMKMALAHLLANFKVTKSAGTKLDFNKGEQFMLSYPEMRINIERR